MEIIRRIQELRDRATDTEDAVITDYLVFLFRDGGALDCAPRESYSFAAVTITTGTTAAVNAYVIAYTGALAPGPFTDVGRIATCRRHR
jgi:hypothetical protein